MAVFANSNIKLEWLVQNIFGKPTVLLTLISLVVLSGLALSHIGYCLAFARSGAVLVSIAVLGVYLNHYVTLELNNLESISKSTIQFESIDDAFKHFKNQQPNRSDIETFKTANAVMQLQGSIKKEKPVLKSVSEKIIALEFGAGFIGTLIWGFGDLLFFTCT